jgi:hypothetical protein
VRARLGPPRWLIAAGLMAIVIAAWLLLGLYSPRAAKECYALYRSAKNSADSARVDTIHAQQGRAQPAKVSCGVMRTSARWQ